MGLTQQLPEGRDAVLLFPGGGGGTREAIEPPPRGGGRRRTRRRYPQITKKHRWSSLVVRRCEPWQGVLAKAPLARTIVLLQEECTHGAGKPLALLL
jgi:hypothetical protein